jgi:dTDP-4-amino-4,6-dideoxygalactose transaminase
MEFFDLKKQYQNLKSEIDAAVLGVLESGVFIGGEEVEKFEKEAADFLGAKHAIGLNSGTDALFLALKSLEIGAGDEVITTPFTFFATAEAIAAVGAKPIFVDIDAKTFNIDVSKIEAAITSKTKAIMPVHLFGQMADMARIREIAQKYNLKIIEDCAQAIGATQGIHNSKTKAGLPAEALAKAGTIGDVGCFSFFPTKNLGAYGDGGMAVTDNDQIAAKIRMLKTHGSSPENKYKNLEIGVNSRLDAIQAAILSVKIKYLDRWNDQRAAIAKCYDNALNGVGDIVVPFAPPNNRHIYHQYTIRTSKRDQLAQFLKDAKIPTMIYFPFPMHLEPALNFLGHKPGDLPEAERASHEVLSLPIYPELPNKEQVVIIGFIENFFINQ